MSELENVQLFGQEVKAVDLPFDFKSENTLWKAQYGITTAPLLVRDANGNIYDDRKFKGVFVDGDYHRLVTRAYVVFPNQEVDKIVHQALDKYPDLHMDGEPKKSHRGDAMYWVIKSDKFNVNIPYSFEKNDEVQLGCVVRNSLGAGIALGADLFTYRLTCLNGAVARGPDLASLAIKHAYKEPEVMAETLTRRLYDIIQEASYLTDAYIKATRVKFEKKIAEALAKRIGQKYLPDYIELNEKTGKVDKVTGNRTLWEAFNDVTHELWHNDNQAFFTKSHKTQYAHTVLLQTVKNNP